MLICVESVDDITTCTLCRRAGSELFNRVYPRATGFSAMVLLHNTSFGIF